MDPMRGIAATALLAATALGATAGDLNPPGAPASTPGPEPRAAINQQNTPGDSESHFVIGASGSYHLPASFTAPQLSTRHGIVIEASHVTLDLGGFTLTGSSAGGPVHGILASGEQTDVTIHSGIVREWSGAGLDLSAVEGGRIHSLTVSDSGEEGILCGPGAAVRSCTVQDNGGAGIRVDVNSRVTNSVARDCAPGIRAEAGSIIEGCVASGNTSEGIRGVGATISRCRSDGNAGRGFVLQGGTLVESAASSNATHGVEAYADFVVTGCLFQQNSGVGICAADRTGATNGGRIEGNTSAENQCGVWTAVETEGLLIVRNHASNNELNYEISGSHVVGPILTEIDLGSTTDPWANFAF